MALYNRINGRKISLLVADGDRTLIDFKGSEFGSSWDLVGQLYFPAEAWQTPAKSYAGRIDAAQSIEEKERIFLEWVYHDMTLLKGHHAAPAQQAEIPYNTGVREYFSKNIDGTATAILSGGLDIIFDRVRRELGMDLCVTNRIGIDQHGMFDGQIQLDVTLYNKPQRLPEIMRTTGTDNLANIMAIGDSIGDAEILKSVKMCGGLAIAINPTSEEVASSANAVVKDFFEIERYTERR